MRLLLPIVLLSLLVGCKPSVPEEKPPQNVFVTAAKTEAVFPQSRFNARIQSANDITITSRVTSEIRAIAFVDGEPVEAGELLFELDDSAFVASVEKAQSDLERANISRGNADRNLARAQKLIIDGYISASELDQLETQSREALAQVGSAEAALKSAEVNLEYTRIEAPRAGRTSRANFNIGDVVGPNSGPLTTLIGEGEVDVLFQVSERSWLQAARRIEAAGKDNLRDFVIVKLELEDGSIYSEIGRLSYVSNRINAETGSLVVGATIANPKGLLRPGQYVNAIVQVSVARNFIAVPQAAIQVDQRGQYVLVVVDSKVERRNIMTGDRIKENIVIKDGLAEGVEVIVRGIQKVRVGDEVTVHNLNEEKGQ